MPGRPKGSVEIALGLEILDAARKAAKLMQPGGYWKGSRTYVANGTEFVIGRNP